MDVIHVASAAAKELLGVPCSFICMIKPLYGSPVSCKRLQVTKEAVHLIGLKIDVKIRA